MIHGIVQTPLKQIHDDRGKVMHMMRVTDPDFEQFGEVYFSWIYPYVVKAWHKHTSMTMHYAVPVGGIQVVLFDDREKSPTKGELNTFYMNAENYYRLTIPKGLWYGFKTVGTTSAMIVNCTDIPHDPNESVRIPFNDSKIPHRWEINHG